MKKDTRQNTAKMSLTNCRFYEEKFPEIDSFVMVNVKQVRQVTHQRQRRARRDEGDTVFLSIMRWERIHILTGIAESGFRLPRWEPMSSCLSMTILTA